MDQEEKMMMLLAEADGLLWQLLPDDADAETEATVVRLRREIHDVLYAYRQRKGVH